MTSQWVGVPLSFSRIMKKMFITVECHNLVNIKIVINKIQLANSPINQGNDFIQSHVADCQIALSNLDKLAQYATVHIRCLGLCNKM